MYQYPSIATYETKIRIFQYKLLNNVPYLNKKYFISVQSPSLNVLLVNYIMKLRSIFFMNVLMHKIFGTNFDYIFQKKLHYQF